MATRVGLGFSQAIDTKIAAHEAATQSFQQLDYSSSDLTFIFHTIHYKSETILPIANKIVNSRNIIGCSTAGLILKTDIHMRGISVITIHSDEMKFSSHCIPNLLTQDLKSAGIALAQEALKELQNVQRHALLLFVDGNTSNNSLLLDGIQNVLGNVFPIIGGGSSDDFHFSNNYQIHQTNALQNAVTSLMFAGQMRIGIGCKHGWKPLGKPRLIDEADGHVIKKIDGKPAADLYKEYLGDEIEKLHASQLDQMSILYPLGIYINESDNYLLRNAVQIADNGDIICQGEIKQGSSVHIMIGNKDSCQNAAKEAAQEAYKNLLGRAPQFILIIESMARLKLLGRIAHKEIECVQKIFGEDIPIFGMYSNGEISPIQSYDNIQKPHHQNESIIVAAIG